MSEWKPIETAPKDGTLLLLALAADDERENPLEDTADLSRTIGFNNFDCDGEDVWRFAGWNWENDYFTEGAGTPVMWAPYPQVGKAYTTGHCERHRAPGGCQLHNLQCGWPQCDRRTVTPTGEKK